MRSAQIFRGERRRRWGLVCGLLFVSACGRGHAAPRSTPAASGAETVAAPVAQVPAAAKPPAPAAAKPPAPAGAAKPPAPADGGVAAAAGTGRPICVRTGTRSEGWAWPNGRFIHWAKCKGVVPTCRVVDATEGWYAHGALIVAATCGAGKSAGARD